MSVIDDEFEKLKRQHQPFPQRAKQVYECEKCKDSGWIGYEDEKGRFCSKRCDCWAMREARRIMRNSEISTEFQSKGFNDYDTKGNEQLEHAKNKAIEYFQQFQKIEHTRRNSIMFCGQVGSGKTHLGTAICSNLMNLRIPVVYMAYRNTVTRLKQKIVDAKEYDKDINQYVKARVLYIDDLLKGKITDSDVNIMYEIINYRYMNSLPIIISTEKSLEELLDFDEAIGSRILEMCRGNIVVLQGRELNYRLSS